MSQGRQFSIRTARYAILLFPLAIAALPHASGDSQKSKSAPPGRKEAPLEPGEIDTDRSRVFIFVGKTGFGHEHAIEGHIKSGEVHLRGRNAGTIEFDLSSFVADTPAARSYLKLKGEIPDSTRRKVTQNMQSAEVLDVQSFPTATFEIDSARAVTAEGKKSGTMDFELQGNFTLHGETHKLTIRARPTPQKDGTVRLTGQFEILQTDFGITPFTAGLGTIGVANRLTIYGDLYLAAEGNAAR